jgi:hypothetical protein
MPFQEQIEKLVTKLTDLTKEEKVSWQETANLNTYLTPVGKFTVTLGKNGSEVYGGYSFQILDRTGKTIDGALALFRGADANSSAFQDWDRLRDLHELARRNALQSAKVVSDLLSSLEQIR